MIKLLNYYPPSYSVLTNTASATQVVVTGEYVRGQGLKFRIRKDNGSYNRNIMIDMSIKTDKGSFRTRWIFYSLTTLPLVELFLPFLAKTVDGTNVIQNVNDVNDVSVVFYCYTYINIEKVFPCNIGKIFEIKDQLSFQQLYVDEVY